MGERAVVQEPELRGDDRDRGEEAIAPKARASAVGRFDRRAIAIATAVKMWVNQSTPPVWGPAKKGNG